MNQLTYGTRSHPGLLYNNPLSVAKIEEVIELLGLSDQATVLDVGSGRGELLIRLIERYQVRALGLELDESDMQHAREQAARRIPPGRLELRACDATMFEPEPDTFDLAICLGACHIYSGFRPTVEHLARSVCPGGKVLVGDCYWKQEPAQEYLAALETSRDAFGTHAEHVTTGVFLGLIPMCACVSNEDEWDHFEWLQMHERFALHKPDDPQLPAVIAQIHAWRDIYLRWERDTLGFGLYLFQKEGASEPVGKEAEDHPECSGRGLQTWCGGFMRHPFEKSLFDHDDAFQAPFLRTDVLCSQHSTSTSSEGVCSMLGDLACHTK